MKTSRKNHSEDTIFSVGDVMVGQDLLIIAGPCAVENEEQMLTSAIIAKEGGQIC